MSQPSLPISIVAGAELFLIADGRPVWPARTPEALRSLVEVAALFGAQVNHVEGRPGPASCGLEVVIGLGAGVEEATRLYAHLTARQFRFVADASEIAEGARPSVIVTRTFGLDDELLETTATLGPGGSVTGIICADSEDELLQQVLIRSAAAALCAEVEVPRIDIYPITPLAHLSAPGRVVLGGKATAYELKDALQRGAGVLSVNTHADGVDAFLGPQLTLCSMDRLPTDADEKRSPRCRQTGICHRMHVPVEEALGSGSLIPPEAISARVLIWSVCTGVILPGGVLDHAWGFTRRLLLSPTLGAIITTWGVVLTDGTALDTLANDLIGGVPVGKALARFNLSLSARQLGYRMCLLGDPRVRVTSKAQGEILRRQKLSLPARPRAPVNKALKEVPFLRACLTAQRPDSTLDAPAGDLKTNQEALASINAYEQAAWIGLPLEGEADAHGPSMRRNIIKHLFQQRGRLTDDWLHLASRVRVSSKPFACFACGRRTNTLTAWLRSPGVARRRIVICPMCGVIEDAPVHARLTLSLEDGFVIRLGGQLPFTHWTASLYLASTSPLYSSCYDWPAGPDERPSEVFAPPEPWPPGPLRIGVIMMWESHLAVVSMPGRGR